MAGDARPGRSLPVAVVCLVSPEHVARIRDELRGDPARLIFVHSLEQLRSAREQLGTRLSAVVLEPIGGDRRPTAPFVADLRARAPDLAILGYCAAARDCSGEILGLAQAGVDHLLFPERHEAAAALRGALHAAQLASVSARVVKRLPGDLPPRLEQLIKFCLNSPTLATSVAAVAHTLVVDRRTLSSACVCAGSVGPETLISWCRVLAASHLLRVSGASVEQVALELDFSSGAALRNMIRRHAEMRTSELRAHDGMERLLSGFLRSLRGRSPLELESAPARRPAVAQDRGSTDAA
jgi:AraC-like DNA-binding protein